MRWLSLSKMASSTNGEASERASTSDASSAPTRTAYPSATPAERKASAALANPTEPSPPEIDWLVAELACRMAAAIRSW